MAYFSFLYRFIFKLFFTLYGVIQRNEFDELLSDCTAAERKSLLRIMQDVKEALFKYKDSI